MARLGGMFHDPLVLNSILLASMERGKLVARAKSALPLQSCRPTQPVRWGYGEDGDGSGPPVVSGPVACPTRDGASGVEPSQGSLRSSTVRLQWSCYNAGDIASANLLALFPYLGSGGIHACICSGSVCICTLPWGHG